jgi:hypothetical protein
VRRWRRIRRVKSDEGIEAESVGVDGDAGEAKEKRNGRVHAARISWCGAFGWVLVGSRRSARVEACLASWQRASVRDN